MLENACCLIYLLIQSVLLQCRRLLKHGMYERFDCEEDKVIGSHINIAGVQTPPPQPEPLQYLWRYH